MNLLSNILIKPNVVTKEGCKFLTDYMKTEASEADFEYKVEFFHC